MKRLLVVLIVTGWFARAEVNGLPEGPLETPWLTSNTLLTDPIPPALEITQEGGRPRITFTGILESADEIGANWVEVVGATSPYQPEVNGERKFYRARIPDAGGLFESRSVVAWQVTGPLQTHFDLAFAGVPDGIIPPRREKPYFAGRLQMEGVDVEVSLRVRGNSSLQECPFPKLKVKVSKEERAGTPFAEAREIKIGTHCAEGGRGTIGRLRDERATYREALAYEVMELLGFTGPRVRRARIEFRDTSPQIDERPTHWSVTRNAVLLEDPEVIAERLGGRALSDQEVMDLENAGFSEQLITDLRFLHVLLGNWDFVLSVDGSDLWNTEVIQLADGRYVPLAGDFDLASWVTEEVLPSFPWDYHPELPEMERQARYQLEQIQKSVERDVFERARVRFNEGRAGMELLARNAQIDEVGRTNVMKHVITFFTALSAAGGSDPKDQR